MLDLTMHSGFPTVLVFSLPVLATRLDTDDSNVYVFYPFSLSLSLVSFSFLFSPCFSLSFLLSPSFHAIKKDMVSRTMSTDSKQVSSLIVVIHSSLRVLNLGEEGDCSLGTVDWSLGGWPNGFCQVLVVFACCHVNILTKLIIMEDRERERGIYS